MPKDDQALKARAHAGIVERPERGTKARLAASQRQKTIYTLSPAARFRQQQRDSPLLRKPLISATTLEKWIDQLFYAFPGIGREYALEFRKATFQDTQISRPRPQGQFT